MKGKHLSIYEFKLENYRQYVNNVLSTSWCVYICESGTWGKIEKHWLRMFLLHLSLIICSWILANLTVPCMLHSPPISPFSICWPPSYWILFLCYCLPVGSHFRPQILSFSV